VVEYPSRAAFLGMVSSAAYTPGVMGSRHDGAPPSPRRRAHPIIRGREPRDISRREETHGTECTVGLEGPIQGPHPPDPPGLRQGRPTRGSGDRALRPRAHPGGARPRGLRRGAAPGARRGELASPGRDQLEAEAAGDCGDVDRGLRQPHQRPRGRDRLDEGHDPVGEHGRVLLRQAGSRGPRSTPSSRTSWPRPRPSGSCSRSTSRS
jgi:hypothetical protein